MNSYVFTYHGNQVQAIHRSMADMVSLPEALASVGFRCIGLPWNSDSNPKMQTARADKDRPRIQVTDYLYKHLNIFILIYKILHLLLFQVSRLSKNK